VVVLDSSLISMVAYMRINNQVQSRTFSALMKNQNQPSTLPEAIFSIDYPILFQPEDTSEAMLKKTLFSHCDDTFLLPKNLIHPPTHRRVNLQGINFGDEIDSSLAWRFIAEMGKRPACPEHLFAVAYQYPYCFAEIQRTLFKKHGLAQSRALAPYEAEQAHLVERLMQLGKFKIAAIGRTVPTCVLEYSVVPALTHKDDFGDGLNLVGYSTERTKSWELGTFFLVIWD